MGHFSRIQNCNQPLPPKLENPKFRISDTFFFTRFGLKWGEKRRYRPSGEGPTRPHCSGLMHTHTNTQQLCYLRHHMCFHTRREDERGGTFQACVCVSDCLLTSASKKTTQVKRTPATEKHWWWWWWWCYWNSSIMQIHNNFWSREEVAWLETEILVFSLCNPSLFSACGWTTEYACVHLPPPPPSSSPSFFLSSLHSCLPRLMKARGRFIFFPFLKKPPTPAPLKSLKASTALWCPSQPRPRPQLLIRRRSYFLVVSQSDHRKAVP